MQGRTDRYGCTDLHGQTDWYALISTDMRRSVAPSWIMRTLRWFDWASTHRNALQLIGQVSDFLSPFLRGKKETTYIVFGAPTPSKSIDFDVRRNRGEIVFFFLILIELNSSSIDLRVKREKSKFILRFCQRNVTSRHVVSRRVLALIWKFGRIEFFLFIHLTFNVFVTHS